MAQDEEAYKDREHSLIKHRFLEQYLRDASFKVLQGPYAAGVFNYVDGFAGPWSVSDEKDCSDSSFDYALNILLKTGKIIKESGRRAPRFRFILCERHADRVKKLQEYAQKKAAIIPDLEIRVFSGTFEDHLGAIGPICRQGQHSFTFTFIDPTGWKLRSAAIARYLAAVRGDFMINFMEHPISRHNSLDQVNASFGEFLGDPSWANRIDGSPDALPREIQILRMLKEKLKATGAAKYTPDFPIKMPSKERNQMRLVLGTHHVQGVEVFRTVQLEAEQLQATTRRKVAQSQSGQQSLFPDETLNAIELMQQGVGAPGHLDDAADRCLNIIAGCAYTMRFDDLAARVMEEVPVRFTNMKDIVVALKSEGKLRFELQSPRSRKPQESTLISRALETR